MANGTISLTEIGLGNADLTAIGKLSEKGLTAEQILATTFTQVVEYINTHYRRYVTTIPQWVKDYETGAYI